MAALVLAIAWGGLMAIWEALGRNPGELFPIEHAHLAFVGWLVNSVIGFALWLLPLDRTRYPQTQGRYEPWMPWAIYASLNGGLLMRLICEPLAAVSIAARYALALSAILQTAAVVIFLLLAWSRVRPPARPARGVR